MYGMNFQNMPELHWQYGYYVAIAAILGLCGWLHWRFQRVGWL
nr:CorA family divalent cation transporter [Reyranella sp.]